MVEPQSYVAVPVTTPLNPGANVEYEVIDDSGNAEKYYSPLHASVGQ